MALQDNDGYVGQLLVKDGIISQKDLENGLKEQEKTHAFLCQTLVELGFASEEKIFSILSLQIGVPYVCLKDIKIDPFVLKRVPASFALNFRCLPLKIIGDTFCIVSADPLDSKAIEEIRTYLGVEKLKTFLAGEAEIRRTIKTCYGI